jgi:BlaI family penicillinase repressor
MNRPIKPITDAEAEIMKILWREARPLSYKEIRTELEARTDWNKSTIQTMLRRLIDKGSVKTEEHYVTLYSAGISESEYIHSETAPFLDRVFGGNALKLVASLCESGRLTADDIEELKGFFNGDENGS